MKKKHQKTGLNQRKLLSQPYVIFINVIPSVLTVVTGREVCTVTIESSCPTLPYIKEEIKWFTKKSVMNMIHH